MPSIEDLVRDSLRQRAEDVEPTPALWLEVDRRVARRRRFQVATWSLAGAAAVLAAFAVVPGLFSAGDPDLQILDRVPASGVVPDTLVADVDGLLELHDLASGEQLPFHAAYEMGSNEHRAYELAVRPGSSRDDFTIVAVRGGDGEQPAFVEVAHSGDAEPDGAGVRVGPSVASTVFAATEADPSFRPSVVWAPDDDAVALTVPADADGASVVLWTTPHPDDLGGSGDETPEQVGVETLELGLVIERDARLLEWVGDTREAGDTSWMWIRRPDGNVITQELQRQEDGSFLERATEPVDSSDPLLDVATSFASGGRPGEPTYLLTGGADGPVLTWSGPGDVRGAVRLRSVLGDVDPTQLWLDAKQDAALVGDGQQTWLLAHDGVGNFAVPTQLGEGYARAALFDAPRPGAADPETEPDAPPRPDTDAPDPDAPDRGEDAPVTDDPVAGAQLPEPVLVGDGRQLRLIGPDGPQTLLTMADEGESWIMGIAVRPGSTSSDLTAAVLTMAEGMWDLRELRVVAGAVDEQRFLGAFPPAYRPGAATSDHANLVVTGPVWSPEGDSLAWLEIGNDAHTLRVIGWSDGPGTGDSATDNAAFEIDGMEPGLGLELSDWVESPDDGAGATGLRGGWADFSAGWISIPMQRQADGAWSQAAGESFTVEPRPPSEGTIAGLAGTDATQGVRWMVAMTFDGVNLIEDPYGATREIELPADLLPGDGIPSYWVRSIGDGALVGSPNTSVAYYLAPDDSINRLPGGVAWADVIR